MVIASSATPSWVSASRNRCPTIPWPMTIIRLDIANLALVRCSNAGGKATVVPWFRGAKFPSRTAAWARLPQAGAEGRRVRISGGQSPFAPVVDLSNQCRLPCRAQDLFERFAQVFALDGIDELGFPVEPVELLHARLDQLAYCGRSQLGKGAKLFDELRQQVARQPGGATL